MGRAPVGAGAGAAAGEAAGAVAIKLPGVGLRSVGCPLLTTVPAGNARLGAVSNTARGGALSLACTVLLAASIAPSDSRLSCCALSRDSVALLRVPFTASS